MTREQLNQLFAQEKPAAKPSKLDALDDRDLELYSMMSQHYPTSQICAELAITREELIVRKTELQKKLGLKDQVKLIQFIAQNSPAAE